MKHAMIFLALLITCWMNPRQSQAGIGMNSLEILTHYGYKTLEGDSIIELGNILLYYDAEKDVVYEQWVKIIPSTLNKANDFFQLLKNEYPKADELGWFQYSENIIVCIRMDMKNMRDYYIHLKLINY